MHLKCLNNNIHIVLRGHFKGSSDYTMDSNKIAYIAKTAIIPGIFPSNNK